MIVEIKTMGDLANLVSQIGQFKLLYVFFRLESTTRPPRLFLVVTWPTFSVLCVCWATPQLSLRPGLALIINLIWCMPSARSFIGMLAREWKKVEEGEFSEAHEEFGCAGEGLWKSWRRFCWCRRRGRRRRRVLSQLNSLKYHFVLNQGSDTVKGIKNAPSALLSYINF